MRMTSRPAARTTAATRRWPLAMIVGGLLLVGWRGAGLIASTQASPGAEANQLHVAIASGDVESLRYWLQIRHADPSSANAAEPDVTPLERCLGLAARVLDAPPAGAGGSRETADHAVSLRVVQQMVTLLHQHGARITDADRRHVSGAVLRWYDDAVSPSVAPPSQLTAPNGPDSSDKPSLRVGLAGLTLTTDSRASCNGSGRPVYLVNETDRSVTATVVTHDDGAGSDGRKSDKYIVDSGGTWRLGCDAAANGRRVRYELIGWR
ncbi:MAG TPA: hypothetical protein VH417_16600 [Vicinamibacterales bacterium]